MKINVKKLISSKAGTKSTHNIDEEIGIIDNLKIPVEGKITLTRMEQAISANFDITFSVTINWEEGENEASRRQIPLNFTRDYLLHPPADSNLLAVKAHELDSDDALIPEIKVNLPVQLFENEE